MCPILQALTVFLEQQANISAVRLIVAYSGGVDSHVLLHGLVQVANQYSMQAINIQPVHINHQLLPESSQFVTHAVQTAKDLALDCIILPVDATPRHHESGEAAARRARYAAFTTIMQPQDILLTAHHQDDQIETVLLRLARGAGSIALAGMQPSRPLGHGLLARPLLSVSRAQIEQYAKQQGLQWIEDPSNQWTRFDRNFLRQEILPQLQARWPGFTKTALRTVKHAADTERLLQGYLQKELAKIRGAVVGTLSCAGISTYSVLEQQHLIRLWLQEQVCSMPAETELQQILCMHTARADSMPQVQLGNHCICRYRDLLYALPQQAYAPAPSIHIRWNMRSPLRLPQELGYLHAHEVKGHGIACEKLQDGVVVRFRKPGERCRPQGRIGSHPLKKLLQEANIPPWERERLPLIEIDGQLAAIVGLWVCHEFAAKEGELGVIFHCDHVISVHDKNIFPDNTLYCHPRERGDPV